MDASVQPGIGPDPGMGPANSYLIGSGSPAVPSAPKMRGGIQNRFRSPILLTCLRNSDFEIKF